MGLEVYRMQSLNIDAARKLGQEEQANAANAESRAAAAAAATSLETPAPQMLDTGTPYSLNTPDILNSLISITTNPFFDNIPLSTSANDDGTTNTTTNTTAQINGDANGSDQEAGGVGTLSQQPEPANSTTGFGDEDRKVFATLQAPIASGSPPTIPTLAPTSVQSMTSQLIKDSLKHTIQSKRKNSGKEDLDMKAELQAAKVRKKEELTPEDEERRRRRRERNKVAATKCRNKKKEKTGLLAIESETLEGSNISLKSEISQLEHERQQLLEVLAAHNNVCTKVHKPNTRLPQIHHPQSHSHPLVVPALHHSPPAPGSASFYSPHGHMSHPHSHSNGYHHPSIHPHLYHSHGVGVGVSGAAHIMHHANLHQHHVVHHAQQSTIQL